MKISSYDKPFITAELKTLHRKKCREYYKHGKSVKYLSLKRKFDDLYKYEAKKYLTKTVNELKFSNPGKMYSILKHLGSKPSKSESNGSFSLLLHLEKNLSNNQSAEIIAEHFAAISQEFSPLIINDLPNTKLSSKSKRQKSPKVDYRGIYPDFLLKNLRRNLNYLSAEL